MGLLRELDKELDRFAKQWFSAPESLLPTLTAEAEAKKREREMVVAQLEKAEAASQPMDVETLIEDAAAKVWSLAKELSEAEPARLRELMERVEVAFTQQNRGKRREYHPVGGRITFRTESLSFASRGDCLSFERMVERYASACTEDQSAIRLSTRARCSHVAARLA